MHERTDLHPIAVLGLGPMGVAIAEALSAAGHHVVAWNRTPRSPSELGFTDGAAIELASSAEAASSASPLVIVCVRDHAASRELIERIEPSEGRVVANLTTGTPAETVESARQAAGRGLRYVTGAVMVPTPMVGTDSCAVLYAGAEVDLRPLAPLMEAMGGASDVVGEDHAVPPALDLAMLDIYFAGMYAHLHATALAARHGIEPHRFLPHAESILDTLRGSLPGLTRATELRTYATGEARLDMCLAFLDHIVGASVETGVEPGLAAVVRDASARAMERWPASTDWDVVAEDLLAGPGALATSGDRTSRP